MRPGRSCALALTGTLLVAAACGSGSVNRCDSAWIGHPRIALTTAGRTFAVTAGGALEQLPALPSVYSGRQSYVAWYRVMRAPRGGWTARLRGLPGATSGEELVVSRPGRRIAVDRGVMSGSVIWSPDGSMLAFTVVSGKAVRIASAGAGFRVRAVPATACSPFAWSRDSKRVAFVASRANDCAPSAPTRLTVVDPSGGAITATAALTAGVWSGPPTWSADGRFAAHSHDLEAGIAIAPRSPGSPSNSADDCSSARWSPVGHDLATVCNGALVVIDAATGHRRSFPARIPHPTEAPIWAADAHALATRSDSEITITPVAGAPVSIPFGGCISAGIAGFDRASGRAVLTAAISPPGD